MSAIAEGRAAYTLGSSSDANPYRKARHQFPSGLTQGERKKLGFRDTSDNRLSALRDLECQWDSGYAVQKGKNVALHRAR
jgi:hypothetical protein